MAATIINVLKPKRQEYACKQINKNNKMKKTIILLTTLLFINTSFVFSQVKVIYKYNGGYKELEFKSQEECGCGKWAVDFFKEGDAKPWGMATNSSKEALEKEIKADINSDYNVWNKTSSDHENFIIYCADMDFGNNSTEVQETKVSSTNGILVEEIPNDYEKKDLEKKKKMTEMFGPTRLLIINAPEKNPGSIRIKWRPAIMGVRGENDAPKIEVESIGITVDTLKQK